MRKITMAKEDTQPTQLDKLKKLREQAAKLEAEVKDSLLSQASQAVKELEELGFTYHLLTDEDYQSLKTTPAPALGSAPAKRGRPAGSTAKPKAAVGPSSNFKPEFTCKVCNLQGHNTRAHNFHPEKFTPEELVAKGIIPPAQ